MKTQKGQGQKGHKGQKIGQKIGQKGHKGQKWQKKGQKRQKIWKNGGKSTKNRHFFWEKNTKLGFLTLFSFFYRMFFFKIFKDSKKHCNFFVSILLNIMRLQVNILTWKPGYLLPNHFLFVSIPPPPSVIQFGIG